MRGLETFYNVHRNKYQQGDAFRCDLNNAQFCTPGLYLPDFVRVEKPPKMQLEIGTSRQDDGLADGKVNGEPGKHPLRKGLRHDGEAMALVKH